jgi:two-component system, LytTR family, response regulator
MIKAIIVDDESDAHTVIKKMLEKCSIKVNIVGCATSIEDAGKLILNENPELIFLDIEMPGGNGFQLLNKFNPPPFDVIFTTAYEQYAIKAFKYAAIDYLLKPIHLNDLNDAVNRYNDNQKFLLKQNRFQVLIDNAGNDPYRFQKIALPSTNTYEMVSVKDIVCCKAEGNYTVVQLVNSKQLLVTKLIKWFEEMLPSQTFYRIHKSYIVNLNLIAKVEKNDGIVIMENGLRLDIAERIKKDFFTTILSQNR